MNLQETPARGAMNLMENPKLPLPKTSRSTPAWFEQARFGLFVHYGLYSILGRGEWAMYFDKIPAKEYNRLADQFRAEEFDADRLVGLARRAGARYIVLGARHHEGFCLWETATTDFNTARTAAGRDLIREYVEACRRAGIRVGLYYSIMSWQWPAILTGPGKDPEGWEAMVRETHAQVRELMTHYGRIDYLWYDGCVVPGLGDATIRARYWRCGELNAMVRELQPEILINDRAALAEDVNTPEQHLTPAPRGRLWECCQTIGRYWGWNRDEEPPKPPAHLIEQMIFCARYGGNFLLNVGPYANGLVPPEQVERLEAIGRWMAVNGEAIHGSRRTPYTEANHLIGPATCSGNTLYFHIAKPLTTPLLIGGIRSPVASIRLLGGDGPLIFQQSSDGCVQVEEIGELRDIREPRVLEVKLSKPPSQKPPPSLLVERDTGRHDPAEAPINVVEGWEMSGFQPLTVTVPTTGVYHLDLSVISGQAQCLFLTLAGEPLSRPLQVECGNYPTTLRAPGLLLEAGVQTVELAAERAPFGLYLWRLQPIWKILGPRHWRTIGPFPTEFCPQGSSDQVRAALRTVFTPETTGSPLHAGVGGRPVRWTRNRRRSGETVNLGLLCGGDEMGVCYARTTVVSPEARDLSILISCDWWANLFVNGAPVSSERPPSGFEEDGAWFNGWKPIAARVRLEKGENTLLLKCHPGSTDNWFTFFLNDAGDLVFSP